MMNRARVIVCVLMVLAGIAVGVAATFTAQPVYVDDVYYWPDDYPVVEVVTDEQTDNQTAEPARPRAEITFLDDSITRQNPDTVVRAVIKRK